MSMASKVISYDGGPNGTAAYLRLVEEETEVTLPLVKATEAHRNFILSTWVRSYSPFLRKWLGKDTDLQKEEALCSETLWTSTWVVSTNDDPFVVHAWACGSPGLLHYVYVPPELRNKGIASALIEHVCGHTFEYGRPWPHKKAPHGGTYNPYLLGRLQPVSKGGT